MKDIKVQILDSIADDDEKYKSLLKQVDINFIYFDETALICAISFENEYIIDYLLELGVNVNISANEMTAICHAAQGGYSRICQKLINKGANLNLLKNHPILLFIDNYCNLIKNKESIETFHILLNHTKPELQQEVMTKIFIGDYLDFFQYIMKESCISVEKRNTISDDLLNSHHEAPLIREYLKSKQFFDSLDKQLVEKNKNLSKIIKI